MVKSREEVLSEDCWNVEALYPSFEAWKNTFDEVNRENQDPKWPEITSFKGRLSESPQVIKDTLVQIFSLSRKIEKLYTYAHLRHDEDITEEVAKGNYTRAMMLYQEFAKETSWVEPELLAIDEDFLTADELKDYKFYLEKIVRMKNHTLSPKEEKLLALAGQAVHAPARAFSALNNADFVFGQAKDSKGFEHEVTHASCGLLLRSQDRTLRKNAFSKLHDQFNKHNNTLTELINGQVQSHLFQARARNFSSCLEAALYPKNIETEVYHALVKATEDNIGTLHKYVSIRKKALQLDKLHLYDLNVPLTEDTDITMPYKDAEDIIIESVAPLGAKYQNILKKGLKDDRWVDRFENKNKRSGAYSSGCFDSMPYILMNYKELLRDVFTLAHEAGHSMHSYLSRDTQPYHYADYSIFVAEVASTFNEDLLMRLMLERANSKEEKIFLINQKIDDIRATLFRQTQFAEFELAIHQMAEQHIPLTPQALNDVYSKLNKKYFGPDLTLDSDYAIEWARIPHFYYNFYVYQYATGISAALALTDRVIDGGKAEVDDYLNFLKAGSSLYPIDALQLAGVNMLSPEPVAKAISKFSKLVNDLEELLNPVSTHA